MKALLLMVLVVTACSTSPAEKRILRYFALPPDTPTDTVALRAAILRKLRHGGTAPAIKDSLAARGVGQDGLSGYYAPRGRDTVLVRVESDLHGWGAKTSYTVQLVFDSTTHLTNVRVHQFTSP